MKNAYDTIGDITSIYITYKKAQYKTLIDTYKLNMLAALNVRLCILKSSDGMNRMYVAYGTRTKGLYKKHLLHRLISNAPVNLEVDHINRNTLDNRMDNLRFATKSENQQNCTIRRDNSSGICGVNYHSPSGKWVARLQIGKRRIALGSFANKSDAIFAREEAVLKYHPYNDPTANHYEAQNKEEI